MQEGWRDYNAVLPPEEQAEIEKMAKDWVDFERSGVVRNPTKEEYEEGRTLYEGDPARLGAFRRARAKFESET